MCDVWTGKKDVDCQYGARAESVTYKKRRKKSALFPTAGYFRPGVRVDSTPAPCSLSVFSPPCVVLSSLLLIFFFESLTPSLIQGDGGLSGRELVVTRPVRGAAGHGGGRVLSSAVEEQEDADAGAPYALYPVVRCWVLDTACTSTWLLVCSMTVPFSFSWSSSGVCCVILQSVMCRTILGIVSYSTGCVEVQGGVPLIYHAMVLKPSISYPSKPGRSTPTYRRTRLANFLVGVSVQKDIKYVSIHLYICVYVLNVM